MDRLSPAVSAEVQWTATGRHHPIGDLLRRYRAFLRSPGSRLRLTPAVCPAPLCALDDVAVVRDEPADAYRALPPEARRALGRVLRLLDAEFRRRTVFDRDAATTDRSGSPRPWWHRQLYAYE
ncbi:hypothetical protein PV721_13950 [Streptomyces sp. MB09-01]|uniref:hypothetical protein n=1 Tax=Streptomyces sp. MB09-01 TaxID=3028666 RepID=UPI0029B05ABF|nr:hypothetical protein [Streptomyces sp. MB09-01]MDX3535454.1 hypothetical protein [Streptomyces sp. MB09-01]